MKWFSRGGDPSAQAGEQQKGANTGQESADNSPAKRLRTSEDRQDEADRLVKLLGQLCKAAGHEPVNASCAESIKSLIVKLIGGDAGSNTARGPISTSQIEELMRAAFLTAKADYWGAYHNSPIDLPKLVEDSLLVRSWLSVGLPEPKPMKSAQIATIIAEVLSELEDEGSTSSLDFHTLSDTASQVVQAIGEVDAFRPTAPHGRPLLQRVLMTVNGSNDEASAYSSSTAHSLGMSAEEASRHSVALALASATRPAACQLLHTLWAFEDAQAAANAGIPYEAPPPREATPSCNE